MLRCIPILIVTFGFCLSACSKPTKMHTTFWHLSEDRLRGDGLIARVATDKNDRGIFAILWIANNPGPTMTGSREEIHHHHIKPSTLGRSIYVLQRDYTLRALPLSEDEKDRLFADILNSGDHDGRELAVRPLWKDKVFPKLQTIPPP